MSRCLRAALTGFAAVLAAALLPAVAQPHSRRPVTIIVPYAPGGGTDTAARMMAAGLERELSATVQVAHRAGAAAQIGLTELTRARPGRDRRDLAGDRAAHRAAARATGAVTSRRGAARPVPN